MKSFRVPGDMPLYDILNEFQKGSSHMAAVVKVKGKGNGIQQVSNKETEKAGTLNTDLSTPLLPKADKISDSLALNMDQQLWAGKRNNQIPSQNDDATNGFRDFPEDVEDGDVIGIITLEDVFEELLQVDFTHHVTLFCRRMDL